jgi:hypothetical protein
VGLSPEERRLRARIGAYALHSQGKTNTRPGTESFLARFLREVDPHGELPEAERTRRAELALRQYMCRLALRSLQARRKAREHALAAERVEQELEQLQGTER